MENLELVILEQFKQFFYKRTGQDLDKYNIHFLQIQIAEHLKHLNITSFRDYLEKMVMGNLIEAEMDELFSLIVNRESDFFRYPEQFEYFKDTLLPELVVRLNEKSINDINILSVGIALGQEPYSIAMVLEEEKEKIPSHDLFRIDAFDLVAKNIHFAQKAEYTFDMLRYFTRYNETKFKEYFTKYFIPSENKKEQLFKVKEGVKNLVHFKKVNILTDPILLSYEVVFFRNVIIYFEDKDKMNAINQIYHCLKKDGYLFLGSSEYPIGMETKFKPIFFDNGVVYKKIE